MEVINENDFYLFKSDVVLVYMRSFENELYLCMSRPSKGTCVESRKIEVRGMLDR